MQLKARRVTTDGQVADTLDQPVDSTFTLSLAPGDWQLTFYRIGHHTRLVSVTIHSDRIDTMMVQMSATSLGVIRDCICADGRGFGGAMLSAYDDPRVHSPRASAGG